MILKITNVWGFHHFSNKIIEFNIVGNTQNQVLVQLMKLTIHWNVDNKTVLPTGPMFCRYNGYS